MLLKSNIPTLDQMILIDKESKRQKYKMERNKASMEWKILPRVKDSEKDLSSHNLED
jgi:hypothetical protein